MRSLLSRRRRMGDLSVELESVFFAALLDDIDRGWLQRYPLHDARFASHSGGRSGGFDDCHRRWGDG